MPVAGEGPGKFDRRTWLDIAIKTVLFVVVYNVAMGLIHRRGALVTFVVSALSILLVFSGVDFFKKRITKSRGSR
jgi:Cu/Ag efflux pump CusA